MSILILNAGSSSLKAALFEADGITALYRAQVAGLGTAPRLSLDGETAALPDDTDHAAALAALISPLEDAVASIGHRVVHGGALFTEPTVLDDESRPALGALSALAPLHNPPALAVIDAVAEAIPGVVQVACFDTAFHARQPAEALRFALPTDDRTVGLQRYGFHGLSYEGLVEALDPVPPRLLACHLGNGASLCAIRDGRSVATTMGYAPLGGLTMGTRVGEIDPAAVLELARRVGVEEAGRLLTEEAGLLGLSSESSDMAVLAASGREEAAFARRHFAYWVARQAGSMIAAMGGIDAIAFTGGIGENDGAIRTAIGGHLSWTGLRLAEEVAADGDLAAPESTVAAWVVPADEEAVIARRVAALV
ncbi:MAG: acetate kinase [Pseudomonadota bacterium]